MANPTDFEHFLDRLSARRTDREKGKNFVVAQPEYVPAMVGFALDSSQARRQSISAWIMELYFLERLESLTPSLPQLLTTLPAVQNESVRRPMSKLLYYFYKKHPNRFDPPQKEQLIALAFDWLLAPAKVATQNFAIKTLYLLRQEAPWILPELQALIKKQWPTASPGFKAAGREILP